jgi:hypothetical protein
MTVAAQEAIWSKMLLEEIGEKFIPVVSRTMKVLNS